MPYDFQIVHKKKVLQTSLNEKKGKLSVLRRIFKGSLLCVVVVYYSNVHNWLIKDAYTLGYSDYDVFLENDEGSRVYRCKKLF